MHIKWIQCQPSFGKAISLLKVQHISCNIGSCALCVMRSYQTKHSCLYCNYYMSFALIIATFLTCDWRAIKTHDSVMCGPGAQQTSVYFTGVKKCCFHAFVAQHSLNSNTQIFCANFLRVGHLQFRIWAESVKPFPRYAPSKFVLFSSFCNILWNCMCFNRLPWNLEHY